MRISISFQAFVWWVNRQRARLAAKKWNYDDESRHPWYGPCDGFMKGRCFECTMVLLGRRE